MQHCDGIGNPLTRIHWYHKDKEIDNSQEHNVTEYSHHEENI